MHASVALAGPIHDENGRIAAAMAAQGPRLRAFVRRQVDDLSDVDDIVQDAFVELVMAWSPPRVGPITEAFMALVRENKSSL